MFLSYIWSLDMVDTYDSSAFGVSWSAPTAAHTFSLFFFSRRHGDHIIKFILYVVILVFGVCVPGVWHSYHTCCAVSTVAAVRHKRNKWQILLVLQTATTIACYLFAQSLLFARFRIPLNECAHIQRFYFRTFWPLHRHDKWMAHTMAERTESLQLEWISFGDDFVLFFFKVVCRHFSTFMFSHHLHVASVDEDYRKWAMEQKEYWRLVWYNYTRIDRTLRKCVLCGTCQSSTNQRDWRSSEAWSIQLCFLDIKSTTR